MAYLHAPSILIVSVLASLSSANFLSKTAELEVTLLAEIAKSVGHGPLAQHVSSLEGSFATTFATLPKNSNGKLGHAAVRYAMQRFFGKKYSWRIGSLETDWNTSSPDVVLQERVPSYVQGVFEKRLAGQGLDVHDLAVLAATLERIAAGEAAASLSEIYNAYNVPVDKNLSDEQMEELMLTYLAMLVYSSDISKAQDFQVTSQWVRLAPGYDIAWDDMRLWVKDLQNYFIFAQRNSRNPFIEPTFYFRDVAFKISQIGKQFSHWQDHECRVLKDILLDIEDEGTGRVRLSKYYAHELSGLIPEPYHFDEHIDLLRDLGALDETDKAVPKIIIPNFLTGSSNCHSSPVLFYDVCCTNECEALMEQIERETKSTHALPKVILDTVADMPSDTVDAPRNFSTELITRLDQIAEKNAGQIPIHGRLFAEWMHRAYPRECPLPVTRSLAFTLPKELWQKDGGGVGSEEYLMMTIEQARINETRAEGSDVSWEWVEEEFLLEDEERPQSDVNDAFRTIVRIFALAALLCSFLVGSMRNWQSSTTTEKDSQKAKSFMV